MGAVATRTDGRRGIGEMLKDLAESGAALVRQEAQLARTEVAGLVKDIGEGVMYCAIGATLAALGALALLAGLVLVIGDQWLPQDLYWLAALIVLVVTGGLAAWFAKRGSSLLAPTQLAPDQTVETLKEDKEWVKRQLT